MIRTNTTIQDWKVKLYWERVMLYREWAKGRSNKNPIPSKVSEVQCLWQVMKLGELTVYNTLRLLEEWAAEFDGTTCKAARAAIPWHSSKPGGVPDSSKPDGSLIADLLTINTDEATDDGDKNEASKARACREILLQQSTFPKNILFKQLLDIFQGKLDASLKAEVLASSGTLLVSRTKCNISELSMVICFSFSLGL